MALNPVTLTEILRPWHGAGFFYLLRDPELEAAFAAEQTAEAGPGLEQAVKAGLGLGQAVDAGFDLERAAGGTVGTEPVPRADAGFVTRSDLRPTEAYGTERGSRAGAAAGTGFARSAAPEAGMPPRADAVPGLEPSGGKTTSGAVRAERTQNARKASASTLPAAWKSLLERTAPAPLLWTYAELGLDLTAPDPEKGSEVRSHILRSLIGELQLPKGSSCFWPITLHPLFPAPSENDGQATDATFFEQGLDIISPKAVILFGMRSCCLAGMQDVLRLPFTQQLVRGRLFVMLPSFDELEIEPQLAARAAVYLRSAFAGFPALFIR